MQRRLLSSNRCCWSLFTGIIICVLCERGGFGYGKSGPVEPTAIRRLIGVAEEVGSIYQVGFCYSSFVYLAPIQRAVLVDQFNLVAGSRHLVDPVDPFARRAVAGYLRVLEGGYHIHSGLGYLAQPIQQCFSLFAHAIC